MILHGCLTNMVIVCSHTKQTDHSQRGMLIHEYNRVEEIRVTRQYLYVRYKSANPGTSHADKKRFSQLLEMER